MVEAQSSERYNITSQALHWLTSAFVLAVLPLAWIAEALPKGPDKGAVFMLHKSVGITILLLIAFRLFWRARHPAPPLPGGESHALAMVGRASHWLLYLIFLVMPVSGYVMSGSGKPVTYFGLFDIPGYPKNDALGKLGNTVHLATQWAVYAFVLLHVLATAWHVWLRRDGLLDRMLPPQVRRVRSRAGD